MTDRADQRTRTRPVPTPRRSELTGLVPDQRRSTDHSPVQAAGPVRTKPIRRSVDLSPACHARLTQWCAEAAEEIGATRVTGQDVIRALVARLLVDQRLARRIRADLSMNI